MANPTDDNLKRLATAARGVRLALDVLNSEIVEMQKLSDAMGMAIAKLDLDSDGKPFGMPKGIRPGTDGGST